MWYIQCISFLFLILLYLHSLWSVRWLMLFLLKDLQQKTFQRTYKLLMSVIFSTVKYRISSSLFLKVSQIAKLSLSCIRILIVVAFCTIMTNVQVNIIPLLMVLLVLNNNFSNFPPHDYIPYTKELINLSLNHNNTS